MTTPLTLDQVREAALKIATAEPNTIVTRCLYANESDYTQPLCIVGRILADVQPETFARFDPEHPEYMDRNAPSSSNDCTIQSLVQEFSLPIEPTAARYLNVLQEARDGHTTSDRNWGSAFVYAENNGITEA